jgi:DNA-binding NarL/FixJ family response regulator
MKRRIVLVEDHTSVRDLLAHRLAVEPHCEVVAHAAHGLEALQVCASAEPDLVVLDLNLPHLNGMEVLRELQRTSPLLKVLVFSGCTDAERIAAVLAMKPQGYVEKMAPLNVFIGAIHTVLAGRRSVTPFASGHARPWVDPVENKRDSMSLREREVLQLIAEGAGSRQIAAQLGIAIKTVENHRSRLMLKLNIYDVASLTRYALKTGVVSLE